MALETPPLGPVSYAFGGKTFNGFFADGSGGKRAPGVLVAHEGPGVTDHIKRRTQEIAALGFIAFALDLYGIAEPPIEDAMQFVAALRADLDELRGRTAVALNVLKSHPAVDGARIAATGFCFGGTAVLELARSGADIAGVVGFHAGLDTIRPADAKSIRCPILVCLGADDPIITDDKRQTFAEEMTAGSVDWQMHVYGGAGHSFTNRDIDAYGFPGFAYNAAADRRSWDAMRAFFAEIFA
ncbi:MAG: dienelactone hydrolase family protein [Parvularculaceae bacterium]|nr:dienelactone hydrolase family protein [Parvularculaceae bacterium]